MMYCDIRQVLGIGKNSNRASIFFLQFQIREVCSSPQQESQAHFPKGWLHQRDHIPGVSSVVQLQNVDLCVVDTGFTAGTTP